MSTQAPSTTRPPGNSGHPGSGTSLPERPESLSRQIAQLRSLLREATIERDRLVKQRRRQILIFGIGISLIIHMALLYYLATNYRGGGGGRDQPGTSYEFAILPESELTKLESAELDELQADAIEAEEAFDEAAEALEPAVPAADLAISGAGALPTLGGSGDGSGMSGSLSGGGAGASFFGISSRGNRFAFIVDRSGSMSSDGKLQIAFRELARSIEELPDFASFYVVLYSSDVMTPPGQETWQRARDSEVGRFIGWLNRVDPTGGTVPGPAFSRVFALDPRPDVIYFLTDGQFAANTVDLVAELNSRGSRVVINTIAFVDRSGEPILQRIAHDSGGIYRFVPGAMR